MFQNLQITDSELILSYQKGDAQAFKILLNRYKDKIFQTIYLLVQDRSLADDLFQETFIKIIAQIRKKEYDEQGKFLQWALRIAHNLTIDYFRRKKTGGKTLNLEGFNLDNVALSSNTPNYAIEQLQTQENIQFLVKKLPFEQREVVALRIFNDLTFKEIAKLTNVSINTALGRMRYALLNLKSLIKEHELELR